MNLMKYIYIFLKKLLIFATWLLDHMVGFDHMALNHVAGYGDMVQIHVATVSHVSQATWQKLATVPCGFRPRR